jgi:hypothetical protein
MLAGFALNIVTRRVCASWQTINRERQQPEAIVMWPVTAWRAGTAIADPLEVIDHLLEVAFARDTDSCRADTASLS